MLYWMMLQMTARWTLGGMLPECPAVLSCVRFRLRQACHLAVGDSRHGCLLPLRCWHERNLLRRSRSQSVTTVLVPSLKCFGQCWEPHHRDTFEAGKNLDTSRTESLEPTNPNTDLWVVHGRSTACRQCAFSYSPGPLQFQRSRSMRHLMPIVTPRLILRPPTLGDLDSIQTAKEEAWPDLQRWMSWAFDNQRSRHAMEDSIRRVMDYQNQAGIALAGFHRVNGDFVIRTALDLTDEQDVYETGYWVAPKYARQGMATEAANAAIRYAFGHLGAKAISIGYFDGNEPSRRIVEKLRFQKVGIENKAATRCLDGTKLDRHEYILTSPDALPELDVSWG
jgi:ribosomal-protein-serine acetyltransferase